MRGRPSYRPNSRGESADLPRRQSGGASIGVRFKQRSALRPGSPLPAAQQRPEADAELAPLDPRCRPDTLAGGMTDEEANAIARRHLVENQLPHADYRWGLTVGREFGDGWYFDYAFEPVRLIPEHDLEQFGVAPGFVVLRDGTERNVSWSEYSQHRKPTG